MDSIIITGASGFVGQNLVRHIVSSNLGEIQKLSLRDDLPATLPEAKALIHLAGKAHDIEKKANDQDYFEVNFVKTKALFDLFLKSNCNDFIYFSSVKATADTLSDVLTEEHESNPKTPYGQSKFQAEEYILAQSLPTGKRVFILRPCMIHGPGNKGNLNLLYKVVQRGIPYPLGAFTNSRSFLSIGNLLYILERIIQDPAIPGGIYNVADDDALPTTELIRVIATASSFNARIWNIAPGLIINVAKVGDVLRLPFNSERLKKLTESYVVSNRKIKNALRIKHLPLSSKDGLFITIRSFNSK